MLNKMELYAPDRAFSLVEFLSTSSAAFSLSLSQTHPSLALSSRLSLPSFPLGVTAPCWIHRAKGSQGPECQSNTGANVAALDQSAGVFLRPSTSGSACWIVSEQKGQIQMVMKGKKEHVRILLSWSTCDVNYQELLNGRKGSPSKNSRCASGANLVEDRAVVYMAASCCCCIRDGRLDLSCVSFCLNAARFAWPANILQVSGLWFSASVLDTPTCSQACRGAEPAMHMLLLHWASQPCCYLNNVPLPCALSWQFCAVRWTCVYVFIAIPQVTFLLLCL